MIGDLKPYPEYKASGLPWLGHVPAHWEVKGTSKNPKNSRSPGRLESRLVAVA